jgi:acyl-CoA thioesterase II
MSSTSSSSILSSSPCDTTSGKCPPRNSTPTSSSSSSSTTTTPSTSNGSISHSRLVRLLELEEIDVNVYRGYSPTSPRWGRIYGGQTVSQALAASCKTVENNFIVHSLHAYFLRAGNDNLPILYYVERLRNGKSFASRRVTALQKGAAIFSMNVSFQTYELGLEHQDTMPVVPEPEKVKSLVEVYRELLTDKRLNKRARESIERSVSIPMALDVRRIIPASMEQRLTKNTPPNQRVWMRVQGDLGDSLMLHQCALAYMSDWSLLETALLPHGKHGWVSEPGESLQMASLDHAMWFHSPFRCDEWLLFDMHSPAASNGRGLSYGKFYSRSGKLIVSTIQEGLIRLHNGPPKPLGRPEAQPGYVTQQEQERIQQENRIKSNSNTSTSTTQESFSPVPQIKNLKLNGNIKQEEVSFKAKM